MTATSTCVRWASSAASTCCCAGRRRVRRSARPAHRFSARRRWSRGGDLRGNVTVVNTLGSGVLENPALHTVLDAVARELLGESLLPSPYRRSGPATRQAGRRSSPTPVSRWSLTNVRTGEEFVGALIDSATLTDLRGAHRSTDLAVGRTVAGAVLDGTDDAARRGRPGLSPTGPPRSGLVACVQPGPRAVLRGHAGSAGLGARRRCSGRAMATIGARTYG